MATDDETDGLLAGNETAVMTSAEDLKVFKRYIWKNVICVSLTFTMNYIAYYGLFALQSSLHLEEGIGTTCTSIRYAVFSVSSLFLTSVLIKYCGHKWTITISLCSFLPWIAANGVGTWSAMAPASVVNGIFDAPLWIAQGSYISELGKLYAGKLDVQADKISTIFFSVFSAIHCFSAVFGSVISTTILKESYDNNFTASELDKCGIHHCPWHPSNNTNFDKPPSYLVWRLVGIYLAFTVVSVIMSIFLVDSIKDDITSYSDNKIKDDINSKKDNQNGDDGVRNDTSDKPWKKEMCTALLATVKLMKHYKLWLLVPLNFYPALISALRNAEWNRSWVTCALGIWMVGYISIPCEVASAPLAFITAIFSRVHGRIFVMFLSFCTGLGLLLFLKYWDISDTVWIYYLVSLGFGIHQGLFDPIVCSIQGLTFPEDTVAAYSCHTFFGCIATVCTYAYSHYMCNNIKVYIVMGSLVLGFLGYFILDSHNCEQSHTGYERINGTNSDETSDSQSHTIN